MENEIFKSKKRVQIDLKTLYQAEFISFNFMGFVEALIFVLLMLTMGKEDNFFIDNNLTLFINI